MQHEVWSHPAENHIINGKYTKQFWNNPYPNGYYGRHNKVEWVQLDYINARK